MVSMPESKPQTPCPTCGKAVTWSEASPWRPFCSERCRLIDLGDWLEERHRIPGRDTAFLPPDENQH